MRISFGPLELLWSINSVRKSSEFKKVLYYMPPDFHHLIIFVIFILLRSCHTKGDKRMKTGPERWDLKDYGN